MSAASHPARQPLTGPLSARRRAWSATLVGIRFIGRALQGIIAAAVLLALVIGLPWALWHYIGWPLPGHLPSWAEFQGVLLRPMTATFLLDFLACLCWITWAAFTLDVARCTVEVARGARWPDYSAAGPVHTLAAVLVGAVVLSVLGNRWGADATPARSATPSTGSAVVATAPAWRNAPHGEEVPIARTAVALVQPAAGLRAAGASAHPKSVVVRAAENGVHDSLYRIAERTLRDGKRWVEIFRLNEGKPQPGGGRLTNPSLIFPGEELLLPADATIPAAPPPNPSPPPLTVPAPAPILPPPIVPPSTSARPPASVMPAPSAQPAPSTHRAAPAETGTNVDSRPSSTRDPAVRWGPVGFVGLGLAAAISAALMVARRRYRSRYRPGSGDRDDLPVGPVVYQLRLAHLRAEKGDEGDLDDEGLRPQRVPPPPPVVVGASETGPNDPPCLAPALGVRDGREIALDLASARGLGLVGPGALAAARALVLAALTASPSPAATTAVLVPAEDLVSVLGHTAARAQLPAAVQVVESLEAALDALEAETLVRAAASHQEQRTAPVTWPPLLLVARPPRHQQQRLQAILDNGAPFGVTGLLLGQWQPGISAYVREDGTVSATSPGPGEALRGMQVFRLGDDDTAELLTLLHEADPDTTTDDEPPAPPRPKTVPAQSTDPARTDHQATADAGGELAGTATGKSPVGEDTELEILGPQPELMPDLVRRSRPSSREAQRPATLAVPADPGSAAHNGGARGEAAAPTTANDTAPERPVAPVRISVLGPPRVFWRTQLDSAGSAAAEREITGALQPRTRELVVFLAVHPDGASREALVAALWAETSSGKTTNALNTALSRLRGGLSKATGGALSDITIVGNGRYRLDPDLVEVDYWRFAAAVAARRAAVTEQQRIDAYRRVVDSYDGPLADGLVAEWIDTAREAIRRDAIDAVAALERALVDQDPQQTLDLLEVARAFDPHNEALYRDIMRLQERLGHIDAIPRTLTLLSTRLAEIDERPSEQAISLAARLRQRHDPAPPHSQPRHRRGHSAAS